MHYFVLNYDRNACTEHRKTNISVFETIIGCHRERFSVKG